MKKYKPVMEKLNYIAWPFTSGNKISENSVFNIYCDKQLHSERNKFLSYGDDAQLFRHHLIDAVTSKIHEEI